MKKKKESKSSKTVLQKAQVKKEEAKKSTCAVCAHKNRFDIEVFLKEDPSKSKWIADAYGLTEGQLFFHDKGCKINALATSIERMDAASGLLYSAAFALFETGELHSCEVATRMLEVARQDTMCRLKLLGHATNRVDVIKSPEYKALMRVILRVLDKHPDALADMQAALAEFGE